MRVHSKELCGKLLDVIENIHKQHADDLCWLDIDQIFAAAGLPVPDRRIGDPAAMLLNCCRYINVMCSGGKWKSYAELEAEIVTLQAKIKELEEHASQNQKNTVSSAV